MNRYSQITPSQFNPLSLQEIMATPLMQRQKHDQLLAQQEVLRQGLAKTNPHEKYYDEAVKLKNDLNSKILSQAELLAKEGVNPNSQADFLSLNREYQDTMSPTGKLGMINAHNVNLQATYKNYIDEAIKAGQSPAIAKLHADQAIQKHMKEPLYDERGRVVDFSVGKAAPKYIDTVKWINDLASKVGFSEQNWAKASSGISRDANGRFVVNASAKGMTKDNIEQLNRLAQLANSQISDPSSEIRQNIDYNFKNPQIELNNMLNQLYSRRERESGITDMNKSISNVDWNDNTADKNKNSIFNDAIQDPTTIKNLKQDTGELDFSRIGRRVNESDIIGYDQTTHAPKYGNNKLGTRSYKDVLTPLQQKFYETAAKRLIKTGRLSQNADLNNTANAEKIGFYMKNHMKFPTVASDIIRADVAIDNKLFSGNLASKDQNSRNATLTQDLRQTEDGTSLRNMIDVETGKKIKFEAGDKVDYLGVESPINYNTYGFGNKFEQSVMPHRAQILDKDGNVKANVVISRTPNEMKDPTFKKMYEINQLYKNGLNKLGEWVKPTSKYSGSQELSKARIKVNDDNTFQIKMEGYEESPKLNNEQFIQQMQMIMQY